MITPSLIYIAVTVLLAFVDAWRIKKAKGIVENINHEVSVLLAIGGFIVATICTWNNTPMGLKGAIKFAILVVVFICIRVIFYDMILNLCRRMKIDYESPTTSSYVDQHTNKLTFWEKRAIGVAGWGICAIVYYVIFKK